MIEHALQYAARNWFVFPLRWPIWDASGAVRCSCGRAACASIGKHPATARGEKDATTDVEQIRAWWTKNPLANIGLATGPSDLCVLDLDGPEAFEELEVVHNGADLPLTLCASTGRGFHIFFRRGGARITSVQRKGAKLGTRASTGYVVAPGSLHASGKRYAWVDSAVRIAAVPTWVAGFANGGGAPQAATPIRSGSIPDSPRKVLGDHKQELIGHKGLPRLADVALEGLGSGEPYSIGEATRLASALAAVPADLDGRTWASWGRALFDLEWIVEEPLGVDDLGRPHARWIDWGLELWDAWSRTSKGEGPGDGAYPGRVALEKRWHGFGTRDDYTGPKVTVASIYQRAILEGWNDGIIPSITKPFRTDTNANNAGNAGHINGVAALPEGMRGVAEAILFPDRNKFGPLGTCANVRHALEHMRAECRYDQFHDRYYIQGQAIGEWTGELTDRATHVIRVILKQQYKFDAGTAATHDAISQLGLMRSYDPVLDYLDGLEWDGRPRLETWLADYLGAERTELNAAIGRIVLVAAVRRAREPGTKFDQITVLEGPEGRGKSSAIEILAGKDNFSDQTILTLDDKGHQEALAGVWLYEIADLAGMSRADVERIKAFASRTVDRARPAYGRSRQDRPRRCVMFATTNDRTYLKSQTGNRRFWPVRCEKVDLEGLRAARDQLWAEACTKEERGDSIALPERFWPETTALQDERREHDPWDELLAAIEEREELSAAYTPELQVELRIWTRDIFDTVLRLPTEKLTDVTSKRVALAMRRLGWDGPKPVRINKIVGKGWTKIDCNPKSRVTENERVTRK